ncbi:MAG TPA: hypothetical protein VMO47_03540 [Rhodothermales bacterium]|nr:hypothetical protein [Rhodothermales bacterium]
MLTLSNDQITVSILDPNSSEDRMRFGTRFCTGGYIFQVSDRRLGDLLSGPTYPDSFNAFDGQGIPDAFHRSPLRDPAAYNRAVIVGIGLCDLAANRVVEPGVWDVHIADRTVAFRTHHFLGPYALDLARIINLEGRSVRSTTSVKNTGQAPFAVTWFPHPFFPQPGGDELCRLSIPFAMRENAGYETATSGFISRKNWPWTTDHYLALDHDAHCPLTVLQRHPKVGLVAATFGYVPRFFPIWGNTRTFSFEPFFENTIAPGQELVWWMVYDF